MPSTSHMCLNLVSCSISVTYSQIVSSPRQSTGTFQAKTLVPRQMLSQIWPQLRNSKAAISSQRWQLFPGNRGRCLQSSRRMAMNSG